MRTKLTVILLLLFLLSSCATSQKTGDSQEYEQFKLLSEVHALILKNHVDEVDIPILVRGAESGILEAVGYPEQPIPPDRLAQFHGFFERALAADNDYVRLQEIAWAMRLMNNYNDAPSRTVIDGAIKGMLKAVDPHGNFMSSEVLQEMKSNLVWGGIGVQLGLKKNRLVVIAPIEGHSASRSNIQAGDYIEEINGQPTKDLTLEEAVSRLRGPVGSSVVLTLEREMGRSFEISLDREVILLKAVKYKVFDDDIGYIRVTQFVEKTANDFEQVLKQLDKRKINRLVLDLRNNPGGLLNEAVEVAGQFLDSGHGIASLVGRNKDKQTKDNFVAKGTKHPRYKVAVLVNGGTAAGSEIIAGALQDWERGVVVGASTFGRGTVQSLIQLFDGSAFKLTVGRLFTPKGHVIEGEGITPDIPVMPSKEGHEFRADEPEPVRFGDITSDIQLRKAIEILKSNSI